MDDLVRRLRGQRDGTEGLEISFEAEAWEVHLQDMEDAADEIERLRTAYRQNVGSLQSRNIQVSEA